MSREDALAHFGVKGMKWGVRNEHRSQMRALNKESKAKDKAARKDAIETARDRIKTGQSRKELKDARAQYKLDKNVIGSREAKKSLRAAKTKYAQEQETARLAKDGKEIARDLLISYAAYKIFAS
jgi:hypothetical protein